MKAVTVLGVQPRGFRIEMQAEGVDKPASCVPLAPIPRRTAEGVDLLQAVERNRRGDEFARDEIALAAKPNEGASCGRTGRAGVRSAGGMQEAAVELHRRSPMPEPRA